MEQTNKLTLGSLFDGSGGFPLGGLLAGVQPVWASEVEPFPIRVTTKRLPFMKHYGDVSKMPIMKTSSPPKDCVIYSAEMTGYFRTLTVLSHYQKQRRTGEWQHSNLTTM